MAATSEGAALTEAHRLRQLQVAGRTMQMVAASWQLMNVRAIDESWATIEPILVAATARQRTLSAGLAARYYDAFRVVEGAGGRFVADPALGLSRDVAAVSLRVTGPVALKRAVGAGLTPDAASRLALSQLAGAASRLALNGGRDTIVGAVASDRAALGYARVTDGSPCAFCAMLAGRGAVYRSETTAGFDAHDKCGCTAEPVLNATSALPGRGAQWSQMWAESSQGASGADARRAFRRAYEAAA